MLDRSIKLSTSLPIPIHMLMGDLNTTGGPLPTNITFGRLGGQTPIIVFYFVFWFVICLTKCDSGCFKFVRHWTPDSHACSWTLVYSRFHQVSSRFFAIQIAYLILLDNNWLISASIEGKKNEKKACKLWEVRCVWLVISEWELPTC